MLNVCNIVGRLGKDPEVRQTQGGKSVVNFTLACERDFKNQDGTKETDWIPCVSFGQTADFISRYARKGRALCVVGRLQVREWTDADGGKHSITEILVNNVYFADSPQRDNGYQGGNAGYPAGSPGGYGGGYQNGNRNQGGYGGGYGGQ